MVALDKYSERKPMFVNAHEKRFDNINKDSLVLSNNRRTLGSLAYKLEVGKT
jgi:hypothetical protein